MKRYKLIGLVLILFLVLSGFEFLNINVLHHNNNLLSITIMAQENDNPDENNDQSSDDDIFNEDIFNQELEKSTEEAESNKLQTLFGGSFSFSMPLITDTTFDNYLLNGGFSGSAFIKIYVPMVGLAYLSYGFSYDLFYLTNSSSSSSYSADSLTKLSTNLMEFFFDFNIKQSIFFRIGSQVIHWGSSFFWTPVDFINIEKYNATSSEDLRSGKPGIKVNIPLNFPFKNSNFFAFFDLYNTNNSLEDISEIPVSLRYDFHISDYEFALSTNFGKNQKTYFGFDFSGALFGFDIYSEISFSKGSDIPIVKESTGFVPYELEYPDYVVKASFGIQKSFGDNSEYSLASEFFYNSAGYDDIPFTLIFMAQSATGLQLYTPMYLGKFYGYISFSKSKFLSDYSSISIYVVSNLSDLSYIGSLTFNLSLPDTLPLSFGLKYYGGGSDKEFTYGLTNNDKITFTFSTHLSF